MQQDVDLNLSQLSALIIRTPGPRSLEVHRTVFSEATSFRRFVHCTRLRGIPFAAGCKNLGSMGLQFTVACAETIVAIRVNHIQAWTLAP